MSEWKSGLFDTEGIKAEPPVDLCCCCCCPQITSAMALSLHNDTPCIFNCCCMTLAASRRQIREENNIKGSWVVDMLVSAFCCCLTSRQLLHEVKGRKEITGPIDFGGIIVNGIGEGVKAAASAKKDSAPASAPEYEEKPKAEEPKTEEKPKAEEPKTEEKAEEPKAEAPAESEMQ